MARLSENFDVSAKVLDAAAATYAAYRVPAAFAGCHPVAVTRAYALAGHVWQRLEACDDGGIIVHNNGVWT